MKDSNQLLESTDKKIYHCVQVLEELKRRHEAIDDELKKTRQDFNNIIIQKQIKNNESFILNG